MSRSLDPSPLTAIGFVTGELAMGSADAMVAATPKATIKLTPRGRQTVRDGRAFDFDPELLAARFRQDGILVPIDTDHSTVLRGGRGEMPNTVGYVTDVEPRDDGLHGKAEWLDGGKAVLAARTHRFVSPCVRQDATTGKTTWLHSVALVSAPAIAMPALASTEGTAAVVATLGTIASALGLPVSTDPAALLAAIGELKAAAVPSALHASALEALTSANDRLATLTATARAKEVDDMLEAALKATKILPFEREHYLSLCSTDGGFNTVKAMLATAIPRFGPSGFEGRMPRTGEPANAATLTRQATLFRDEQARKGVAISYAEAVRHVEANPA